MKGTSFEIKMLTEAQYRQAKAEKALELQAARQQVQFWVEKVREIVADMKELEKIKAPDGWKYGFVEELGWGLHPPNLIKK